LKEERKRGLRRRRIGKGEGEVFFFRKGEQKQKGLASGLSLITLPIVSILFFKSKVDAR
jgi:hypothetical protein